MSDASPHDPRDLLDAISKLSTELFMMRGALDRIAQIVDQDASLSAATRLEVHRVARIARGESEPQGD